MRDNVRSLIGHREKKKGSGGDKPFFSNATEFLPRRIDLQYSNETYHSIPYTHIHQIELYPADPNIAVDDPDVIFIDCPSFSRTEIIGSNLSLLYEALKAETVEWIREANADEKPQGTVLFIQEIAHVSLTDWRVELERIEQNREEVLGKRLYSLPGEPPAE